MASFIGIKMVIDIGSQPYPFAQPFTVPILELDNDPAVYQVGPVAVSSAATIWDGEPLDTTFNLFAAVADRACDFEFTVDGGEADEYHWTIPCETPGIPLLLSGGQSFAGQSGTEDAFTEGTLKNITKIRVLNRDSVNELFVNVCLAKASA